MPGDKIRKDDIIDPALFEDAIKGANEFLVVSAKLEEQTRKNLVVYKETISAFNANKGSKALKEQASATIEATKELEHLERLEQARAKTQLALVRVTEARDKALKTNLATEASFNKAVEAETKSIQKLSAETLKLNSVYEQIKKKYNDLSRAQIELSVRGREGGVVFKSIKEEATKLRAELDKAEQGAGRFQRNVGNYASGFDSLGNSVNQLTRELPAFAVSANTGFLAISNNLPILFDNLARINKENAALIAQGQPVESAFSKLGKAIFSVGSLLSVGITLLTLYGGAIAKTIVSLFDQSDAFELNAEAMKLYQDEIKRVQDAQDDLDKSIGQLQKDLIRNQKLISEAGSSQLDAIDESTDKYLAFEKARKKAVADIIVAQLQAGDKEVEITTNVTKKSIDIINKKNGTIIRLDKDLRNVLQKIYQAYAEGTESTDEKAIQQKLDNLNKESDAFKRKLDDEYRLKTKNIFETEKDANKIRKKFSDEDLVKKRSAADEIRQLEIDNIEDAEEREKQQIAFNADKQIREIDDANKTEILKKQIANRNYQNERALIKANVTDVRQQNIDLEKLRQDHIKEIKKIEAENISPEEQAQLRLQIEIKTNEAILAVDKEAQRKREEQAKIAFQKTIESRARQADDAANFEIYNLEQAYQKEKDKQDFFNAKKLNDQIEFINDKKKIQIQADADEKIALTENEQEKIEIQKKANIEKLKLDNQTNKTKEENDRAELKRVIDFSNKTLDLISKEIQREADLRQKQFSENIKISEKNVETQRRLAEAGKANTLVEEQKNLAKQQLEQRQAAEEQIKIQEGLAFIKLIGSYAEKNPEKALTNAIRDIAIEKAVRGAFYKGTEGDKTLGEQLGRTNTRDGHLILADDDERIFNPENSAKMKGVSSDKVADIIYDYKNGLLDAQMIKVSAIPNESFAKKVDNSMALQQMAMQQRIIEELREIKNKPVQQVEFSKIGEFIETTIINGNKEIRTHKISKRLG